MLLWSSGKLYLLEYKQNITTVEATLHSPFFWAFSGSRSHRHQNTLQLHQGHELRCQSGCNPGLDITIWPWVAITPPMSACSSLLSSPQVCLYLQARNHSGSCSLPMLHHSVAHHNSELVPSTTCGPSCPLSPSGYWAEPCFQEL